MITGEDSPESEKMGYEHGVMSYIKKPYQPDVVKQVVENVVDLFQYKMLLEVTVKSQTEKSCWVPKSGIETAYQTDSAALRLSRHERDEIVPRI